MSTIKEKLVFGVAAVFAVAIGLTGCASQPTSGQSSMMAQPSTSCKGMAKCKGKATCKAVTSGQCH